MSSRARVSLWAFGIAAFVIWTFAVFVVWSAVPVFSVIGSVTDASGDPLDGWNVTITNGNK